MEAIGSHGWDRVARRADIRSRLEVTLSRRIVNQLIGWRNLAGLSTLGMPKMIAFLQVLLVHNILPLARQMVRSRSQQSLPPQKIEAEAENLAELAALDGIKRINLGRMFCDTITYEGWLLLAAQGEEQRKQARKRAYITEQRQDWSAPQADVWLDRPSWLTLLQQLLVLARRPWVYITLYTPRNQSRGWKGELAEVYLGDSGRQSNLTHAYNALGAVVSGLNDVLTVLDVGESADPLMAWFERLQSAAGFHPAEPASLLDQIQELADGGTEHPEVRDACRDLRQLTRTPDRRDALLAAHAELFGVSDGGPAVEGPLRRWLDVLPSKPANDLPPATVLTTLASLTRTTTPPQPATPMTERVARPFTWEPAQVAGSFPEAVDWHASRCCDRELLLRRLAPRFPRSDALDAETRSAVLARLGEWERHTRLLDSAKLPAHTEVYLWAEIPAPLRRSDVLQQATTIVQSPDGECPGLVTEAWQAALLAVTLDQYAVDFAADRGLVPQRQSSAPCAQ